MVTFLVTHQERGDYAVVGPITGLHYIITPGGTPVSDYDAADLLKMTGPPCCGKTLPFGAEVRLFGRMTPSGRQLNAIPANVLMAKPIEVMEEEDARNILRSRTAKRDRGVSATGREPSAVGDGSEMGELGGNELDIHDLHSEHRPSGGEVD